MTTRMEFMERLEELHADAEILEGNVADISFELDERHPVPSDWLGEAQAFVNKAMDEIMRARDRLNE